jgi:alpha-D-ribose 1-methylphosphonate 5-triphosphate synthase subunit PhnI
MSFITEAKSFTFTFMYIDELEIKETTKHLPLPHFLTFTSNLIPVVNFQPDIMTKETTSILLL